MRNITPNVSDRAVIVGMTGSGKTTLAKRFLMQHPYVVIHDFKGRIQLDGFVRLTTLNEVVKSRMPRIIYAPDHKELSHRTTIEKFFQWIYERQRTTLYVDEVYSVATKNNIPHYYRAILTRGRELGICCISSTQRPMDIPQVILSESEHYYVFRLMLPQDRKKVTEIVPLTANQIQKIKQFEFYYANSSGDILGPLKLSKG